VKEFQQRMGNRVRNVPIYYDEDITDRVYVQAKALKRLGVAVKLPHYKFIECSLHTNSSGWAGFTFPRLRADMAKHNETMQGALNEKKSLDAALLAAGAAGKKAKPPAKIPEKDEDQNSTSKGVADKIASDEADKRLASKDPSAKPDNASKTDEPGPVKIVDPSVHRTLAKSRKGQSTCKS
jgi:hypothetical protein